MADVRPTSELPSPLGVTSSGYERAWRDLGCRPRDGAIGAYSAFFRKGDRSVHDAPPPPSRVMRTPSAEGEVVKFLLPVDDSGFESESVIIPMRRRHETTHTLCVSSQIGCAMGCEFCETAQMGLVRNLEPAHIVSQWWAATHHLRARIRNVVFMGMGEPLDNLENVLDAVAILTDHFGPSIGMRRTTISTVGRIDGLLDLRERVLQPGWRQLNLAVSLNAPNDEIRSSIMPINRAMPLGQLIPILEDWPLRKSGRIMVEYVLIPGVNDALAHADELADLVTNVRCCVNVIPYNPRRESPWPAPSEESVWAFLERLEARGQFCKKRRTKGRHAMAACGQLGSQSIRKRKPVQLGSPGSSP